MMEGFELKAFDISCIKAAAQIERLCFSEPWSEQALTYMCSSPNAYAVAAAERDSGRLAAYGGVQYVLDEANIVNIATHPDFRRKGCASAIIDELEAFLRAKNVVYVYLEVRASNTCARSLYEKKGFTPCGIIKSYYRFPAEDAVVMMKELN